jgi:hypothetical protein
MATIIVFLWIFLLVYYTYIAANIVARLIRKIIKWIFPKLPSHLRLRLKPILYFCEKSRWWIWRIFFIVIIIIIAFINKLFAPITYKRCRQIASYPEAEPEVLRKLSKSWDVCTQKLVAGNPNTPIDTLWDLISDFPNQILENPVWPLVMLTNPNWIEEVPEEKVIALLKKPGIPSLFIDAGVKSSCYYIRQAVAEGILTDARSDLERLESLVLSHQWFYPGLLTHPNFNPMLLLKCMASDSDSIQWHLITLCFGDTSEGRKIKELQSYNQIIGYIIKNCQAATAEKIVTCYEATLDSSMLKCLCLKLSHNRSVHMARNISTPRTLKILAERPIADDRQQIQIIKALIQNPKTPKSLLHSFSTSSNQAVRSYIAQYAPLTAEMFTNLAIDSFPKTRNNLLQNRKITPSILHDLARHPNPEVMKLAKKHPSIQGSSHE